MKKIPSLVLLLLALQATAQKTNKLLVSLKLQPELTFHKNRYNSLVLPQQTKASFNIGVNSALQYNITDNLFVDLGIGYLSRRLNTKATFDQYTLPAPYTGNSDELVTTISVAYKTVQIPFQVGYVVYKNSKIKSFVLAGATASYLLATKYNTNFQKYARSYKKGYWQGISYNSGIGADLQLNKKLSLTSAINYTFTNPIQKDEFLRLKADEGPIALPHNALQLSVGVKLAL